MTAILIVPGLGGSGPEHWQTVWEARDLRCVRVQQDDWDQPERVAWCARLEAAVIAAGGEVVLVAHSLGCLTVAHWAAAGSVHAVKAALLVAPPDAESTSCTVDVLRGFAPVPRARLPFPSTLVASRNDAYARIEHARDLAAAWGARFVDVGELGHINAASRLGDWPAGRALLDALL
ncbi:MAG: alpha/beta hydrolase [Polyangiales bacterium]